MSWLELFYDLVYVATVIELGNLLARQTDLVGATAFAGVFVAVWWSWSAMMFFANRFLVDDPAHRVLMIVQMFALSVVAVAVGGIGNDGGVALVAAYAVVRAVLVVAYVRAYRAVPDARPLTGRYAVGFGLAVLVWFVSLAVPPDWRPLAWLVALALEFAVPLSPGSRRLGRLLPPDVHHLTERYGLLTIIVLGESFIKVVAALAQHPLEVGTLALAGCGFVVAAGVWWLYFERVHVAGAAGGVRNRYLWIYAHLPLTLAITTVGVGLKKLTVVPIAAAVPDPVRWVFGIAVAVTLLAVALLEWAAVRPDRRLVGSFVVAAALVVGSIPVSASWSALPVGVSIATLVAMLVVAVEWRRRREPLRRSSRVD